MGVLFILLRQIERWLHQHIFKVGWLLSHNYETTTILYYTIFLPGVLLHEVIYWLMAGVLNVRADRAIQWPEKQEIGNLQLNFIKLSPKANPLKKAVIAATPLITGLLAIWIIAVNIFQLETAMEIAATGSLEDIAHAMSVLTSTADFWLWFYISFTIANTMFPTIPKDMKGWWQIGGVVVVILVALLILGIGQNLLGDLTLSLGQILNSLSLILVLTITINIIMVIILGAIESAIERITGHSATFQKGKMITMTREEVLKLKQEQQEKRLATRATPRRKTATTDPISIYMLEFPIPGPPGQEPITKGVAAVLGMDTSGEIPNITDEDEVFETTATDSTRQRMLKLFGDPENKETKSIADDIPALPSSPSSPLSPAETNLSEDVKARPKPEFDVQAFAKPKTSVEDKPKSSHIDDDDSIKRAASKLDSDIESVDTFLEDNTDEEISKEPVTKSSSEITLIPSQRNKINLPTTPQAPIKSNDSDDSEDDDDEQLAARTSRRSSIFDDLAKPTLSVTDEDDSIEDDINQDTPAIPTWRSKINLPTTPTELNDEDDDDDEQLAAELPKRSSIFDDLAKPTLSNTDEDDTTEDDIENAPVLPAMQSKISKTTTPKSPFKSTDDDEELSVRTPRRSSIFDDLAKPTLSKTVESEEDTNEDVIEKTNLTTEFSRPFARREVIEDTDEEDEESDEESIIELDSQFPRPFAPSDKLDTSSTESLPSWRSQLASTPKSSNSDDDEDDEQLSSRVPRRSSMFDSLNKSSDEDEVKSALTPSWRSQLASKPKSSDSDDDEDDEQLSSRVPRRSSMFDSLNKSSDEDDDKKSPQTPSWRSQLASTLKSSDSDDDEQLSSRIPRRSSMFDSLNKSSDEDDDKKSPQTPSWRSQLASTPKSSNSADDDDDEQLPRTGSLLSGLGRPQAQQPRSTIKGSGSRPAPKPISKTPTSDWRSQLASDKSADNEDEDDEELNYEPIDDEFSYDDEDDYLDDDSD